jgi:hypothetical protein
MTTICACIKAYKFQNASKFLDIGETHLCKNNVVKGYLSMAYINVCIHIGMSIFTNVYITTKILCNYFSSPPINMKNSIRVRNHLNVTTWVNNCDRQIKANQISY